MVQRSHGVATPSQLATHHYYGTEKPYKSKEGLSSSKEKPQVVQRSHTGTLSPLVQRSQPQHGEYMAQYREAAELSHTTATT